MLFAFVSQLVNKNYDSFVMDDSKDVVVMLYRPECKPCNVVKPKFYETASMFKKDNNIRVSSFFVSARSQTLCFSLMLQLLC